MKSLAFLNYWVTHAQVSPKVYIYDRQHFIPKLYLRLP